MHMYEKSKFTLIAIFKYVSVLEYTTIPRG